MVAELQRADVEFATKSEDETPWHEGPHESIMPQAWRRHAADLAGALTSHEFREVDGLMRSLEASAEFGFTRDEAMGNESEIERVERILKPLAEVTWFDRRIWRL